MPTIPQYITREGLPATGGVRGGVLGLPVVQQPGLREQGASAFEQALGAPSEAVQTAGATLAQIDELKQRRQRAFDTLNGQKAEADWRIPMQQMSSRLLEEDYQTYPERLVEEGGKLIQEAGGPLTPYARAIFDKGAKEYLAALHMRALDTRTKRTEQDATYTFARQIQQAQTDYANATNDYDRMLAKGRLEENARLGVAAGLFNGEAAANAVKKATDAMDVQTVQQHIQVDPDAARIELMRQLKGEEASAGFPKVPREHMAQLHQEAVQVTEQRLRQAEHTERVGDYRFGKQQDQSAADIRGRLTTILPTPENVPQYDALLEEVNRKAQGLKPAISGAAQQEFTSHIRTLRAAALKPREVDDGPTERRLTILLDAADNDREYQDVRAQVVQSASLLKPETTQRFLNQIYERRQGGHYTQLNGYKEGIRVILGGDIAEGNYMAMLRGSLQEAEQARLRTALDVYRERMATLAGESRDQANADAPRIALEIRRAYMDVPAKEERLRRLPLPLQGPDGKSGVQDEEKARQIVNTLPHMSDAEKKRTMDQWKQWRGTVTEPVEGTTPQQGTQRQRVRQ